MDGIGILSQWLNILNSSLDSSNKNESLKLSIDPITSSSSLTKSTANQLTIYASDSSILIEPLPLSNSPAKHRITLFKDKGYTERDVDHLLQGYVSALSSTSTSSSSSSSSHLSRDRDRDRGLENHILHFFTNQFKDIDIDTDRESDTSTGSRIKIRGPGEGSGSGSLLDPIAELKGLGIEVYERESDRDVGWEVLAGYEEVKREVEETIVHAVLHPEVYDSISSHTRAVFKTSCNRPKAVLFEGPPGTGKTLTARILANQVSKPMIHLSVEHILSKWYGESEKKLSKIFDLCERMGGAVLFIDEIDALATSRDSSSTMHEATRRILSVILQHLEGFQGTSSNILVCATNRKQDLDSALLSRFDICIHYHLPNITTRHAIYKRYAKQLKSQDLDELARLSHGLSCRDIRDVCAQTERQVASKIIRKEMKPGEIPQLSHYLVNLQQRLKDKGHGDAVMDM
eukprot:CAMPEP_0182425842 /NCGR_PEP_ID=MMETSP1167-20130531/12335_1 /TAXON_ID=2988 /ORGANISM="Mallomonas Sp, Strain CCMP3275" /LENGTH=458 /DNA_ID=CAMNT_0024606875 /DNA_START=431 /DNA_END=1807 /DNA_ORIENTATION=+